MIVNHDRRFIFIRVPRTASGALKRRLAEVHGSEEIGHHREAITIPDGLDGYTAFGIIRNPLTRLYSLWNYCRGQMAAPTPVRAAIKAEAVDMDFDTWLTRSTLAFTGGNEGTPYEVAFPISEIDKGQDAYLTSHPRLTPRIFRFEDLNEALPEISKIAGRPIVLSEPVNRLPAPPMPKVSAAALSRVIKGDRAVVTVFYPELLQQLQSASI